MPRSQKNGLNGLNGWFGFFLAGSFGWRLKVARRWKKLHTARGYKSNHLYVVPTTNTCCRNSDMNDHFTGLELVFLILIGAASSWTKPNTKFGSTQF